MTVTCIAAHRVLGIAATLGEGPVWDRARGVLWFVDIAASMIYRFAPGSGALASWRAPSEVGWVALGDGSDLVAGLTDGLYQFSPADGGFVLLHAVEPGRSDTRINDGTRDRNGICWFGTLSRSAEAGGGRFYRYDGTSVTDIGLPPVQITNGPAVSPDGRTLYTVDTLGRAVHAHAIGSDGRLTATRLFVTIPQADGYPDGVTCDAEGGIWLGLWNGWAARRYDADGLLTDVVRFPVANVTKVALGGADGKSAYATTAREGEAGDRSGHQPLGGDLFCFAVRVSGFTE